MRSSWACGLSIPPALHSRDGDGVADRHGWLGSCWLSCLYAGYDKEDAGWYAVSHPLVIDMPNSARRGAVERQKVNLARPDTKTNLFAPPALNQAIRPLLH